MVTAPGRVTQHSSKNQWDVRNVWMNSVESWVLFEVVLGLLSLRGANIVFKNIHRLSRLNTMMYVEGESVCECWECLFVGEPWLELLADRVLRLSLYRFGYVYVPKMPDENVKENP